MKTLTALFLAALIPALPVHVNGQESDANSQPITTTSTVSGSVAPKPAPKPKVLPKTWGDRSGPVYIGHRFVAERYTEWGWVWRENETYRKARWVMLEEEPGVRMAPGRFLSSPTADNNYEYRLYGEFAPYKGYDPNYDLFVEVFRIKGFEVIGPAAPLDLKTPRPSAGKRRSTSFSRSRNVEFDY